MFSMREWRKYKTAPKQSTIHNIKKSLMSLISTPLRVNSNENQWNGRNTPPLPYDIVEFSLIVTDTRTHLRLKGFHGENLNANVYMVSHKKGQMLDK